MTPISTNLHFHGLTVPPVCHQDDVLKTSIQPDDAPFDYRLRIPDDAAPSAAGPAAGGGGGGGGGAGRLSVSYG